MTAAAAPLDARVPATPDQPKARNRIECLDLIRGLAVMGIVLANLDSFGGWPLEHQWPTVNGPLDAESNAAWLFNYLFVDGKLRGLFSLLFGAGMVIFLERARARAGGGSAISLQVRRLFWLMIFGLLHFYLLFTGDILHNYAIAGLLALLFVRIPPKWLLGLGVSAMVLYSALPIMGLWDYMGYERAALSAPAGAEVRLEYEGELEAERRDSAAKGAVLAGGSLTEIIADKWEREPPLSLVEYADRWLVEYLSLMLIGAALFRMGFFSGEWDRRKMLLWGGAGILVSFLASLALGLWAIAEGHPRAVTLFVFYGPVYPIRLPMIIGYAAVLVAFSEAILRSGIGRRIAAAGRMAFSNYLGSSLVMALVFQGFGLGLLGTLDRAERLPFAILVWALILLWSKPWLEHFRFGPMEWLWRCLTYGKLFPIRRAASA